MQDKVSYQTGLNFSFTRSDLLVVDESDSIIFSDPLAFKELLARCRCICLTATPDDNNKKGAEKQIISALRLTKYDYGFPVELTAPAVATETKALPNDEAILLFIKERISLQPVLLYCSQQTKEYIEAQGYPFVSADGEDADEQLLKELDTKSEGEFRLVVATEDEAMRGINYRAPLNGISLLVAKSFENVREADQGMKRVGRFGDPC